MILRTGVIFFMVLLCSAMISINTTAQAETKGKVVDIIAKSVDIVAHVEDISGNSVDMKDKVVDLSGKSANIKSSTGAIGSGGPVSGQRVSGSGPVSGQRVSGSGPVSGQRVSGSGPVSGQRVSGSGPVSGQRVSGSGPVSGQAVNREGPEYDFSDKPAELQKNLEDLGAKKVGEDDVLISVPGDILFDFDKWNIRPEAEETLNKIAKAIIDLKKTKVFIEGHTDSKGSDEYNLELSRKRADSVRDWFFWEGSFKGDLSRVQFMTKGFGESRPVAPNTMRDGSDNPEGRQLNRRVEVIIR